MILEFTNDLNRFVPIGIESLAQFAYITVSISLNTKLLKLAFIFLNVKFTLLQLYLSFYTYIKELLMMTKRLCPKIALMIIINSKQVNKHYYSIISTKISQNVK